MLDPRLLRAELTATAQQLARRGYVLDVEKLAALEAERKTVQVRTQELQATRNSRSRVSAKPKRVARMPRP